MQSKYKTWLEILLVSFKLGCTSFGGPIAHLGYFREEYVKKKKWLDDSSYADIVALCQFLPGPASSQVGLSIGLLRGGVIGSFLAWFGFTMPSVFTLILFAHLFQGSDVQNAGWLMGLKITAVAVVAQAVMGMGKSLAPDRPRVTLAVLAAIGALFIPSAWGQIGIIAAAAIFGCIYYKNEKVPEVPKLAVSVSKKAAFGSLILFAALLVLLPVLRHVFPGTFMALFDVFYRVGSLVFGGGHVVLPMLEKEVVPPGWVTQDAFLAGYGAAQAVPGPLFTLAAYIGAVISGIPGALIATAAMFLPSFLLVMGVLPFWSRIRSVKAVQAGLMGVNAAVVGILLAALYHPVFTSAIHSAGAFALALSAFALLVYWKLPPWLVVVLTVLGGTLMDQAGLLS
ncbi:chromate efflux transporter [Bacillus sp. FJAT-42376]|uniref:chromate efflux transporter n=1 Tax=Bacillus sp. FJAT-42376 TaxID=2014076 RepID=UPI000F503BC2|nr:chromate efflux transporter [Bacillus sp. FJAT-42376]AZB42134.1 chromate efflux transporter [Bacillus sp. FJAT-42376]